MRIVFTFADQRLAHDCQRCGDRCCGLDGFALPTEELLPLLEHEPDLALFARATRTSDYHALRGVGGRCPALRAEGGCRIHARFGYAAKPYVCKLYPANQLYQLGETLLVELHADCPVERVEVSGEHALPLLHAPLREFLSRYEKVVRGRSAPLDAPAEGADALIAAGCDIRDLMATHSAKSVIDLAAALGEVDGQEDRAGLESFASELVRFLHGEPDEAERLGRQSDADLALALPRLFFFALAASALPPMADLLRLLPRVTVVLGWLAQRRRGSGPLGAGSQALHTLCSENFDLALWLAHLDRAPVFCAEPDSLPLPRGIVAEIQRVLAFVYRDNESAKESLATICERVDLNDRLARITTLAALPPSLWRALRFE